jgi:hypothetical protein
MLGKQPVRLADHCPGGEPVPLSEHEQRLLEQMERALYAEDPKFASSMRGSDLRARYRRRAVAAGFVFVIGVALLMTGAIITVIPLAIVGFVVMLGSLWYAVTAWRRVPTGAEQAPFPTASGGKVAKLQRRKRGGSFMQRVEERWRRRRESGN